MHAHLKTIGLAMVAALALMAVGAATASAHTFDSEIAETFLTAAGKSTKQVFEVAPKKVVECETIEIKHENNGKGEILVNDGEIAATFKETGVYTEPKLNIRPTYGGCETEITGEKVPAFVEFGECYYAFEGATESTASMNVHCPKEQKIHIKITSSKSACISIPEQTIPGSEYVNTNAGQGSSRDFDVNMATSKTKSQTEGTCGSKEDTEGAYKGDFTISGTNKNVGGSQTGVWVT